MWIDIRARHEWLFREIDVKFGREAVDHWEDYPDKQSAKQTIGCWPGRQLLRQRMHVHLGNLSIPIIVNFIFNQVEWEETVVKLKVLLDCWWRFLLYRLRNILFPTLICSCYQNEQNKDILEQEVSCALLNNYLEDQSLDFQQEKLGCSSQPFLGKSSLSWR